MQLDQLRNIVMVHKHGAFSRAAKELYISQSAISQSVNKLENKLQVKIFERSFDGVQPTIHGEQLIKVANEILFKMNEFTEIANNYKDQNQTEIKIGIITGLYLPFLPKILSFITNKAPNQTIKIVEKNSIDMAEAIINKKVNIGIFVIYEETKRYKELIHFKQLYPVNLYVFVNQNSPLAKFKSLKPEQLKDETFVMFNGQYMNWFYQKLNQNYGPFNLLFISNKSDNITKAVYDNVAISIETESEVLSNPYVVNRDIIPIPLHTDIHKNNFLGLAYLKGLSSSSATVQTSEIFENAFKDRL